MRRVTLVGSPSPLDLWAMHFLDELGIGVAVFTATNVDDLFILALFFADARTRARAVVLGQFLGIGALWAASALLALAALAIPPGWIALLGLAPLALGLRELWGFRRGARRGGGADGGRDGGQDGPDGSDGANDARRAGGMSALSVAAVTIANGGDNLAAYVPLFASSAASVGLYGIVFAVCTAGWCWLGHRVATHPSLRGAIARLGRVALPIVLVLLGLWILAGAF